MVNMIQTKIIFSKNCSNYFNFRVLSININEFSCLCRNLFRNEHGKPYHVSSLKYLTHFLQYLENFLKYLKYFLKYILKYLKHFLKYFSQMDSALLSEIFLIFNVSGDGSMNIQEFVLCWNMWIKKVQLYNDSQINL